MSRPLQLQHVKLGRASVLLTLSTCSMALWTAANMSTLSSAIMSPSQPASDPTEVSPDISMISLAHAENCPWQQDK